MQQQLQTWWQFTSNDAATAPHNAPHTTSRTPLTLQLRRSAGVAAIPGASFFPDVVFLLGRAGHNGTAINDAVFWHESFAPTPPFWPIEDTANEQVSWNDVRLGNTPRARFGSESNPPSARLSFSSFRVYDDPASPARQIRRLFGRPAENICYRLQQIGNAIRLEEVFDVGPLGAREKCGLRRGGARKNDRHLSPCFSNRLESADAVEIGHIGIHYDQADLASVQFEGG